MIDHIVVAGGSLANLERWFAHATGVEPSPGGPHVGVGTRNALAALGGRTYLELIAPDPEQPEPAHPRPFGIDDLTPDEHRLTTFALAVDGIDAVAARLAAASLDPGPVRALSRTRPDGVVLAWKLTMSAYPDDGGVLPFLIEWGDTPHPSASAATGCTLDQLRLRHPEPARIAAAFELLGLDAPVAAGPAGLTVALTTPNGAVTLN